jgi:LETM1-like protein
MVNPSANGWIEKFLSEQKNDFSISQTEDSFYLNTRKTGFIFGFITSFDLKQPIDTSNWLSHEVSKIALLHTLFNLFQLRESTNDPNLFINNAVAFYDLMQPESFNVLKNLLPKGTPANHLEEILNERVQTNENILHKNFSHLVTNALLFVDILAFNQYLMHKSIPEKYLKRVEETIISLVSLSLKTKTNKSDHDTLLIKMFEASVRLSKFSEITVQNLEGLNLDYYTNELEKKYFIDITGLTLWSDGIVEKNEAYFLYKLAEILKIDDQFVATSIQETNDFIQTNLDKIPYFNDSNPVKNFYDKTTQTVVKLILRNKKRILKEISESKELMLLLAKSTQRDLDATEKKKVKSQLLDICKTVPSLTIFLIPGGSLLLPILIKFIPQLLPSSFNENLEED